jgi:hypothetical protein
MVHTPSLCAILVPLAPVVELADTTSLSLVAERRAGSWPVRGTARR